MTTAYFHYDEKESKVIFNVVWEDGAGWWSACGFIAEIIVAAVTELECKTQGIPVKVFYELAKAKGFSVDDPDYTGEGDISEQEAHDEWHAILKKIIWSFQQTIEEDEGTRSTQEMVDAYNAKVKEGRDLFTMYFDQLWD